MSTDKRNTFSLLFIIKKAKLLKNGEAPIYLRVTINKQIAEIGIKRSVPVEHWNQAKESCNSKGRIALELNHYLETVKARILQIHRELEIDGKHITSDLIRDIYHGRDEDHKSILEVYKEHNDKCHALIGKDYTELTVEKFETSIKCLKEYIIHQYHKDDILLSDINHQFVTNYEFYLKTERNLQHNSTIKHLKNLKKVIRIALANDWIKKDPFANIQFRHEESNVEFLSYEELEIIRNKTFSIPRLEIVRDVFVFCCMTGLSFIDVQQLTPDHLIKDSSEVLWIRKSRQKTGNMCNIPVIKPAQGLIDKYAGHPDCIRKNVLLPVMSNQKLNSYLKEIADLCGITKRLTMHSGRHTCATVVMLANNVSLENVAKILGHSNTKMTQHYAKVLDSSILRDMGSVEARFEK